MVAPFRKVYGKIRVGFCLSTGKRIFLEREEREIQKEHRFFKEQYWGFSK